MDTTIAFVAFLVSFSVTFGVLTFWVIPRFIRSDPIIPRRKKKEPAPYDPAKDTSRKRQEYIDSIRWKGELFCPACSSTLERVPINRHWYEDPIYDPMTGLKLGWAGRHGPTGLMVCAEREKERLTGPYAYMSDQSFQGAFEKMEKTRHGMYFVDKPPLEPS